MLGLVMIVVMGGVAVAVQAQLMGVMDRGLGTMESVFITYVVGGVLIALVIALYRGGNLLQWPGMPWYTILSGVFGLVIVGSIGYAAPRMGVVPTLTLLAAAQFIVGALIDHFGLMGAEVRPINPTKIGGMALMLLGVRLLVR